MAINSSTYLVFNGQTREALAFYQSVFGGEASFMTFGQMGDPGEFPADAVMHGQLDTPFGWSLMAADSTKPGDEVVRGGSSLVVWGDDVDQMSGQFEALSAGGQVGMPLAPQAWGALYGGLTDKFGIEWGFNISQGTPPSKD